MKCQRKIEFNEIHLSKMKLNLKIFINAYAKIKIQQYIVIAKDIIENN